MAQRIKPPAALRPGSRPSLQKVETVERQLRALIPAEAEAGGI